MLARLVAIVSDTLDPALVLGGVRALFREHDALTCADALCLLLRTVHDRDTQPTQVWLYAWMALATDFALSEEVAGAARRRGYLELLQFWETRSRVTEETKESEVTIGGRKLSLGERKSLGRTSDRELLKRALLDSNETVVSIALANPRAIEEDVVRVAAERRVHARSLMAVFCSTRWMVRHGVRLALAQNPVLSLGKARQLALTLRSPDRERVFAMLTLDGSSDELSVN